VRRTLQDEAQNPYLSPQEQPIKLNSRGSSVWHYGLIASLAMAMFALVILEISHLMVFRQKSTFELYWPYLQSIDIASPIPIIFFLLTSMFCWMARGNTADE